MQLQSTFESNKESNTWMIEAREALINLAQARRMLALAKATYEQSTNLSTTTVTDRDLAVMHWAEYQRDFAGEVWEVDRIINRGLILRETLNDEARDLLDIIVTIRTPL